VLKEIGSEFWRADSLVQTEHQFLPSDEWPGDKQYFVSGRSALYAIIKEIKKSLGSFSSLTAYLPSYCCHTMIDPFLQQGVSVDFYPVVFKDGSLHQLIDPRKVCDIILVMDYFGFSSVEKELPKSAIVVRDMTHALLSYNYAEKLQSADYLFASFRKWGPVAGASVASKKIGEWREIGKRLHNSYISLRMRGYELKADYIEGKSVEKYEFLDIFSEAEDLLEQDYIDYAADEKSISEAATLFQSVSIRRRNADFLLQGLNSLHIVEPIFPKIETHDVPLFLPILVKNNKRDALRKYLIENSVYCPIHWPLSLLHSITKEEQQIYSSELSLICDQRYGEDEMNRQLELLRSYESRN
jgi:hypothetical protein